MYISITWECNIWLITNTVYEFILFMINPVNKLVLKNVYLSIHWICTVFHDQSYNMYKHGVHVHEILIWIFNPKYKINILRSLPRMTVKSYILLNHSNIHVKQSQIKSSFSLPVSTQGGCCPRFDRPCLGTLRRRTSPVQSGTVGTARRPAGTRTWHVPRPRSWPGREQRGSEGLGVGSEGGTLSLHSASWLEGRQNI